MNPLSDQSSTKYLTNNLKRLRKMSQKNQGELAKEAGISRVGYRNIETGAGAPRLDTLLRIAKALNTSIEELLAPTHDPTFIRFRSSRKMTSREEILATLAEELAHNNPQPNTLPALRNKTTRLRPNVAAAETRKFGLVHPETPLFDPATFLESLGILLIQKPFASEGFFGLSASEKEPGGPAILVNSWERIPIEKQIFTAAQELGHLLLHPTSYNLALTEEQQHEAADATHFAATLLIPDAALPHIPIPTSATHLMKLKRIYRTSWQTLLSRITTTLPKSQRTKLYQTLLADWKQQTGKTIAPENPTPQFFHAEPNTHISEEPFRLHAIDFMGTKTRTPALHPAG